MAGNRGVLANLALDRALHGTPAYTMAALLRQVITAGAPPSMARLPLLPAQVAACYDNMDDPHGNGDDEPAAIHQEQEGTDQQDSPRGDDHRGGTPAATATSS